jgi:hypothetical protein
MSDQEKIRFELVPDEDGYPPIRVETLNAANLGEGKFRIQNAPFFVANVSYGDVVDAKKSQDGGYDFVQCLEASDFKSISIILLNDALDKALMDLLRGCNAVIEYGEFGALRMVAIAIPGGADYPAIKRALDHYEADELISYAELAV